MRLNLLDRYVENFGCLDNDNPIPNPDKKKKISTPPHPKAINGFSFNKKLHCSAPTIPILWLHNIHNAAKNIICDR